MGAFSQIRAVLSIRLQLTSLAREPIYSTSVGRWRQYDWLCGEEWEQLASLASS